MKHIKYKLTMIWIISLLIAYSCNINDEQDGLQLTLPPITQTGANTFGCYVDGKLLIPRDGTGTIGGPDRAAILWGDPSGNQQYTELDIADFKSDRTGKILIHIQNLNSNGEGNYIIDQSNGMNGIDGLDNNYIHCRVFDEATNSYQYYRSFENSGVLKITRFDWPNGIISGVFSCSVKNSSNPNDIIEITQGRFDINGYTLPNTVFP